MEIKKGFTWIPSGMTKPNKFDIELGVVLVDNSKDKAYREEVYDEISIKISSKPSIKTSAKASIKGYIIVKLCDRNIIISPNPKSRRLESGPYDLDDYIHVSWQDPQSSRLYNFSEIMYSSHYGIKEKYLDFSKNAGLRSVLDSGGYQIISGVSTSKIDPFSLVKFYNKEADVGVALDFPPTVSDFYRPKNMLTLALFQKRNSEILMSHKRKDLQLLNTIHGYDLDSLRRYAAVVDDPRFVGYAVGGAGVMKKITAVCMLLLEYKAQWCHLLGVSGTKAIPALIYLSQFLKISSDSSTQIEGSKTKKLLGVTPEGELIANNYVSKNFDFSVFGESLECACRLCRIIENPHFFNKGSLASTQIGNILVNHNMFVLDKFFKIWKEHLKNSRGNFNKYYGKVKEVLGDDASNTLLYAYTALTKGLSSAESLEIEEPEFELIEDFKWENSSVSKILAYPEVVRDEKFLSQLPKKVQDYLISHRESSNSLRV